MTGSAPTGIIATDLFTEQMPVDLWARVKLNGIYQVVLYGIIELALLGWIVGSLIRHRRQHGTWTDAFKDRWIRNSWLPGSAVHLGAVDELDAAPPAGGVTSIV